MLEALTIEEASQAVGELRKDGKLDAPLAPVEAEVEGADAPEEIEPVEAPESEAASEGDEIVPESGDDDAGEPEEVNAGEGEAEEAEQPSIDPPKFWTAEEKASFKALSPELQRVVVEKDRAYQAQVTKAQMEASEARKAAEQVKVNAERIDQLLNGATVEFEQWRNVDWNALARENPDEYIAKKQEFDHKRQLVTQLEMVKRAKAEEDRRQRLAAEMDRVKERIPDFADPGKAKQIATDIADYLRSKGATDEQIEGLEDALYVDVLHDAMRYHRLSKSAPKSDKTKPVPPKVVKPAPRAEGQSSLKKQLQDAQKRLESTGSQDAAREVMRLKRQLRQTG